MKTFGGLLKNELKLNIRNMNMVILQLLCRWWFWSSLVLSMVQNPLPIVRRTRLWNSHSAHFARFLFAPGV